VNKKGGKTDNDKYSSATSLGQHEGREGERQRKRKEETKRIEGENNVFDVQVANNKTFEKKTCKQEKQAEYELKLNVREWRKQPRTS
jgi:hypothetical protein